MKTWTQFKTQLPIVESVIPMNRQYGFLGTAGDQAHDLLSKAVAHVKTANKDNKQFQMSDKTIGHFLDSKGGRHLADLMTSKADPDLIQRALKNSITDFSKMYNPSLYESFYDDGSKIEEGVVKTVVNRVRAHMRATKAMDSSFYAHDDKERKKANKEYKHYDRISRGKKPFVKSEETIQESDPHMTKVMQKASSTEGRFAAAKRREADKKAREEYLKKQAGHVEPEKKDDKPAAATHAAPAGSGIYHSNPAKRMEHHRALRKVLDKPLKAHEASDKIKKHFDDERLHSDIHHFAKSAPDTDVRPLVKKRMEQLRKQRGF